MNKVKRPKIGEYVLLARWSDKSMHDPWEIGFLTEITERATGFYYKINKRLFSNCWRITSEEGATHIEDAKLFESLHYPII